MPTSLPQAAPLTKLELSFEGCTKFTDDTAKLLAAHLPTGIELLVLEAAASGVTEVIFASTPLLPRRA